MSAYTLGQMLQNRRPLLCARETDSVGDALHVMLTNHIAQLPVITDDGSLCGLISQQSILSMYFYGNGQVNLLHMPVAHCKEPARTLTIQDDLLAAIDQLGIRGAAAVIVMDADRPIGILTGRDMTHFFRTIFEGILLIEQIELTLRKCIALVFPTEDAQRQAQLEIAQPERKNRQPAVQSLHDFSLTRMVQLIAAYRHWPRFEPLLGPKALFEPLLERVRRVRNAIAHFQGQPDALELDTLRRTALWLANRRDAPTPARNRATPLLIPDVQLHPLTEILAQRKPPLCIGDQAEIGAALELMVEHRYAQVPVVDSTGRLIGMITQPTLLSLYYFTAGEAPLLTLPLHHAIEPAATLTEEDTFFEAVELLTMPGTAAVTVIRDQRPIGILTGKDMTQIFRTLCEGIILVERIELGLRDQIGSAYPTEEALNAAAIAAFGADPENPHYAVRNPHKLSFGDEIQFITDQDNWPRFEPVLGPQVVFRHLMDHVRQVRNKLLHFRGQLDRLEREALIRADGWLRRRPLRLTESTDQ